MILWTCCRERLSAPAIAMADALTGSAATSGVVYTLPTGFRPKNTRRGLLFTLFSGTAQLARYSIAPTEVITLSSYSGLGALYGDMRAGLTLDVVPGTLPGVAI